MNRSKLRVLTWHVHGNYLHNLTQVPHEFHLPFDAARSTHLSGRSGTLPWGDNVFELPVEAVRDSEFDVVVYQSRAEWEGARLTQLSEAQRRLPRIYIEHDPPQEHPTDTVHWVDDPEALLVHVTPFNALMWNSGRTPVRVIDHGIEPLSDARYEGRLERGCVVVNNIASRGRRLGFDVWQAARERVPLTLYGMNSIEAGGEGEIENRRLPGAMAAHRFFFHPIRYTSLGLAVIEAMMVGLPIVGLATTELVTVIENGRNGFIDTRVDSLVAAMRELLGDPELARRLGQGARRSALERFGIDRFVSDWMAAFALVAG